MTGELITKFPGSEVGPVSVPVPYTKADGTTGTDLYLGKDGQAWRAGAMDEQQARAWLAELTDGPFLAAFTFFTAIGRVSSDR